MKIYICIFVVILNNISFSQQILTLNYNDTVFVNCIIEKNDEKQDTLYFIKFEKLNKDISFELIKDDYKILDCFWKSDSMYNIQYYYNGVIKQKSIYLNGYILIFDEQRYINNQIFYSVDMSKDIYEIENFHFNGSIKKRFTINKIYLFGKYEEWYENGQKKEVGYYGEDGEKDGIWYYYTEEGNIDYIGEYENGILIHSETSVQEE